MCITVSDIDAFMPDAVRYRHRRESHVDQQADVAVPEIMDADPLDTGRLRASIHLMMQIVLCDRKHTVRRPDPV